MYLGPDGHSRTHRLSHVRRAGQVPGAPGQSSKKSSGAPEAEARPDGLPQVRPLARNQVQRVERQTLLPRAAPQVAEAGAVAEGGAGGTWQGRTWLGGRGP